MDIFGNVINSPPPKILLSKNNQKSTKYRLITDPVFHREIFVIDMMMIVILNWNGLFNVASSYSMLISNMEQSTGVSILE